MSQRLRVSLVFLMALGCINFINEREIPIEIIKELIVDCSSIDLLKMKEEYLNSQKI